MDAASLAPTDELEDQFQAMVADPSWAEVTREPKIVWRQPMRVAAYNEPAWFDATFREHAAILSCATGVDIQRAHAGQDSVNMQVFFGADPVVRQEAYPEGTLIEPFCWAVESAKCFAFWRPTFERGGPGDEIAGASIYIDPAIPEVEQRRCLAATMTRAMGGGSADVLQKTVFREHPYDFGGVPFSERVTANDQVLLRALYDSRIDPKKSTRVIAWRARDVIEDAVTAMTDAGAAERQPPDPVRPAPTAETRRGFCTPSIQALETSFVASAHGVWGIDDKYEWGEGPLRRLKTADFYIEWGVPAKVAKDAADTIERFARLAGIPAAPVDDKDDATIAIGMIQSGSRAAPSDYWTVFPAPRASVWACQGSAHREGSEITAGYLALWRGSEPLNFSACLSEELTWIFGLPPAEVTYRPSTLIRRWRDNFGPSIGDEILMRALYDPRLSAGMTAKETAARLPEIMQDLVDRLYADGIDGLYQR